jgi:hypothetical protein
MCDAGMKNQEHVNPNVADEGSAKAAAISALIRQCSESGRLISGCELERQFMAQYRTMSGEQTAPFQSTLARARERYHDLHELAADDGTRSYFSSQNMTQAYAVMLLQRQGDPARLIAEVVRENSAAYPRPVPRDIFTHPPFDLTGEEVLGCLEQMARQESYRDIASTTTSAATVFLYSTLHLEPDHASMLAEWLDVGQFNNP